VPENAVAGISEIINVPGLINVDFRLRTVMAEQGMAMMGSAAASESIARASPRSRRGCPLLEGVNSVGRAPGSW